MSNPQWTESACVEFQGVAKHYGTLEVLRSVDVTCPSGCSTAIVGASGSGKTTLLRMVNGLVQADAGETRVFGAPVPVRELEPFRRKIGYAVQGAGLFPHLTAYRNIGLVAQLEGWAHEEIERRVHELLKQMELPESIIHRYPRELSGGQQQRVGLCRALMLNPALLLLDEPFSAVDPITRVGIYERFEEVQAGGVSCLLVTHDLREARRLSDYIVIVADGSVVEQGMTQEVLDHPSHEYVQRLVRSQLQ